MQCRYRTVLSIDGGGIRGILALHILKYIQKEFERIDQNQNLTDWIDLFAGTSTGAIISGALMLSDENGKQKFTVDNILELYKSRGKQIFNKERSSDTLHPEYPLKLVLEQNFGKTFIKDAQKHFLLVSYDINSQSPFIFTDEMKRYQNISLAKVMMACSVVPGYFPAVELGGKSLADGMLTAKNPAQLALAYAKLFYPEDPIILISLGTGKLPLNQHDAIEEDTLLTHSELEKKQKEDEKLIYFRFQPDLMESKADISDTSIENLSHLEAEAKAFIQSNITKFQRLFQLMSIRAENN